MSQHVPAEYRMLFPLAPILAIMVLSLFDIPMAANGLGKGSAKSVCDCADSSKASGGSNAQNLAACCQKIPSRFSLQQPKYRVKFASVNHGGVDYDAGNQMIVLHCLFEDLTPEKQIVGMSEMGNIERLQSDAGTLVEGGSGNGIISPNLTDFKSAPFLLHAKVPLATKALNAVCGAITVLRANDRASLAWREPFGAEIGRARRAGDFEIALTKCAIANDFLVAEWSCKAPVSVAGDSTLWNSRQLHVGLMCSDKSTIESESGTQTSTTIRRIFRLSKKFPVLLDMTFVSSLSTENLHFELPAVQLDGAPPPPKTAKAVESNGQNF